MNRRQIRICRALPLIVLVGLLFAPATPECALKGAEKEKAARSRIPVRTERSEQDPSH